MSMLRNADIFIALLVLFLASFVGLRTYNDLYAPATATSRLAPQFRSGHAEYRVYFDSKCIGNATVDFSTDDIYQLTVNASLRVYYQETLRSVAFSLRAFFNPLKQLLRSATVLQIDNHQVRLETKDVSPVTITVSAGPVGQRQSAAQSSASLIANPEQELPVYYQNSFTLAGPILLRESGRADYFGIEMQSDISKREDFLSDILKLFDGNLSVDKMSEDVDRDCDDTFEFDNYFSGLEPALRNFMNTLGSRGD